MAIRRVTGAVSPSELVFADANALGATYDGTGTTIERGETFTLPAAGTTAVSNGALRLEALKGNCTITNNGNSTLTNASGVDGTIIMRSGSSDFPAFVKNSSLGSMSVPARASFGGEITGNTGTLNSNVNLPAGSVVQVVNNTSSLRTTTSLVSFTSDAADAYRNPSNFGTWANLIDCSITPKYANSKILVNFTARFSLNQADDHALVVAQQIGSTYVSTEGVMRAVASSQSYPALHGSQLKDLHNNSANAFISASDSIFDTPSSTGSYSSGVITYSVRIARYTSGGAVYRNRCSDGRENAAGYDTSGMSTMVLLEVKQ